MDPNNRPVTTEVEVESGFFRFDSAKMLITQNNLTTVSVNQTIKVTLKNDLNLTATYSMQV